MVNFNHSKPIDLRKSKQRQENQVYSTETWMLELVTFDIVPNRSFSSAKMQDMMDTFLNTYDSVNRFNK